MIALAEVILYYSWAVCDVSLLTLDFRIRSSKQCAKNQPRTTWSDSLTSMTGQRAFFPLSVLSIMFQISSALPQHTAYCCWNLLTNKLSTVINTLTYSKWQYTHPTHLKTHTNCWQTSMSNIMTTLPIMPRLSQTKQTISFPNDESERVHLLEPNYSRL